MLSAMQHAVECVLTLFLMGLVGYVLDRRRWFTPESRALIPKLVVGVTLPPYLFVSMLGTFNRDELFSLMYGCLAPAVALLATYFCALGLAAWLRLPRPRRAVFIPGLPTSNTVFIGLPVNIGLFGPEALPYALLYYFTNTIFFWTIGNWHLQSGGAEKPGFSARDLAGKIFSPPLLGFFAGLVFITADWRPPKFFMDAAASIGSPTTPLAMIFIGLTLAGMSLGKLKPERDVVVLMLGRFVLSPLIMIVTMRFFDLPPLMAKVFVIQSSLPMVSNIVLMTDLYKADTDYAAMTVSLSTIMALATIPCYMALVTMGWF